MCLSTADAAAAGDGEIRVEVYHNGTNVPCFLTKDGFSNYKVDFTPSGSGTYMVYAYMNDLEVRGENSVIELRSSHNCF